jgi:outer membrane protein W
MLGGNVQFSTQKNDGAPKSDINFNVVPSIGYFISNNFAVGTGVGYQFAKYYSNTVVDGTNVGSSTKVSAFVVSPFARYYKNITDQFKFYGQLSVPMSFGTTKDGDANGDNFVKVSKDNNVGVALSPGFAFFPSKKFGIEFSVQGISYNDQSFKDANDNKIGGTKDFSIGANFFNPNLGVQFFF